MTELIWAGKYADTKKVAPVRIALPFQTIETVNESAQDRQRTLDLLTAGRETEWRNRLIWGDKKYVLPSLLPEFAGRVNLIYIDPPFDTGADFSYIAEVPEADGHSGHSFVKEPSILEQKAYRDTWGRGLESYLQWFYETILLLRDLLAEDGSIYVHLDWRMVHYAKTLLDEVFGTERCLNEIIWKRTTAHSGAERYAPVHDTLLYYSKSAAPRWNKPRTDYDQAYLDKYYRFDDGDGRLYWRADLTGAGIRHGRSGLPWRGFDPTAIGRHWIVPIEELDTLDAEGKIYWPKGGKGMPQHKRYRDELKGKAVSDVWDDVDRINPVGLERTGYPTQKPAALLDRVLKASSREGDLVLDCFVGSGTTAVVAEKLGRRWLACDLSRFAIHTARKRLLSISGIRPFVVQNLGKYERQAWQAAEFAESGDFPEREKRYRRFILDLYHATAISGHTWLHGTRSGRMVHVGAVDAPITLADVKAIASEVWRAMGKGKDAPKTAGVDVLGWEFAFELNELARQVAAEARVDVSFKKIPREVLEKRAVEQGDIRFFELAALAVEVKVRKREITLTLSDFIISPDDIPEEVRRAIKHWSQYVDYWAVDWDYREDTFHNVWQTYRTKKDPKLQTTTAHTYDDPGRHVILVKVIDILGNDTTKAVPTEVK